jgi:hypothetical protein
MNANLRTALENFKHCADEAPEGCYEEAKRLNEVIGDTCTSLMREVRSLAEHACRFRREQTICDRAGAPSPWTIIATVTGR